jgi:acyl-CoA thioesterase
MGDLGAETSVTRTGDGTYSATVHDDWEIWGPCGGYVAAIALRAAAAESPFARPASFFCHYLSVASFAPVELAVTPLRAGRTVLAQRVTMTQEHRPVLEAMVWSVGDVQGLEHREASPPDVPDPEQLSPPPDLPPDAEGPRYAFWDNFDQRVMEWSETWPPAEPLPPTWRTWLRYRPRATFDDPWVDAARALIVLDVGSWPAGSRPHAYREHSFIAPSLDLYAAFSEHPSASSSEWLLVDAHSPVAAGGLLSWTSRVWSRDRHLLAGGGGQAVFRHA